MATLQDYIKSGAVVTLIMFLSALGTIEYLPDKTFYCPEDDTVMECDRLSNTLRTCYPYPGIKTGSKLCDGTWNPIEQYLKQYQKPSSPSRVEDLKIVVGEDWWLKSTDGKTCYYKGYLQYTKPCEEVG